MIKKTNPAKSVRNRLERLRGVHGIYNPACLMTMLGALSGCLAMTLSISGQFGFALIALMLAGLADLFDGYVARRLALDDFEKSYGIQLDTVVDVLSFIAAPAVIGLLLAERNLLVVACIMLYMLAGLVRLAHFNTGAVSGNAPEDAHTGLPVTYAALFLPIAFVPMELLGGMAFQFSLGGMFLLLAVMFVAPMTVPKPRGLFYLIFPLLAAGLIVFWVSYPAGIDWSPR